jgi:hypothetical protein
VNLPSIYSRVFRGGDPQSDTVALDGNDSDANIVVNDDLLPYLAREHKHSFAFPLRTAAQIKKS